MIEFDPAKLNFTQPAPKYCITYHICYAPGNKVNFTEDEMKLKKWKYKENINNRSCFADFRYMLSKFKMTHKKDANRILYVCDRCHDSIRKNAYLSDEDIKRWIVLCKANRLMPKNIGKHFVETMNYVVNLDKISYNRLYMYLTAARHIQEMPHFITAMLHLVDDVGIDFFIAFNIASLYTVTNSGHHIINMSRDYRLHAFRGDVNKTKEPVFNEFSLMKAAKLAKFAYSKDSEGSVISAVGVDHFKLHKQLEQQKVKGTSMFQIARKHLLRDEVVRAVRKGDLTEISDLAIRK